MIQRAIPRRPSDTTAETSGEIESYNSDRAPNLDFFQSKSILLN